ncbi:MAG: TIGR03862 family flavoprotein [Pseudomonadota bacterium]
MAHALVIGAGPAGLMAAETLASAGVAVTLCDAMPTVGRKFLMAGKSGLNLTKLEAETKFLAAFAEAQPRLAPMLKSFGPQQVQDWARSLGQEVFTGSTGRVFPVSMKASPLLRAWRARLESMGVEIRTRWRWTGWAGAKMQFETPDGVQRLGSEVCIFALGGASWARLGSNGAWFDTFAAQDISLQPFSSANVGVSVNWSTYMQPHIGTPIKAALWRAGPYRSRGEAMLSDKGLEGGGVYTVCRGIREGHALFLDLLPNIGLEKVVARLLRKKDKTSLSNHLRKSLRLSPVQIALIREMVHPLPADAMTCAQILKALPMRHNGLLRMDEAISTAGGVRFDALTNGLMMRSHPGTFVAGEMLDWEAPTGGYLLTGCLATGRWAAQHAIMHMCLSPGPIMPSLEPL